RGQHEDAGADDAADAEEDELDRAQGAMQRFLFGGGENGVEWFYAPEDHRYSPEPAAPRPRSFMARNLNAKSIAASRYSNAPASAPGRARRRCGRGGAALPARRPGRHW